MFKPLFFLPLCLLFSLKALAAPVDIFFVYTPDGKSDFEAANASEDAIMSHINQNFSDAGTAITFRKVGSYLIENYQEDYYGDDDYEDFNDTQQMHYDLLTAGEKGWVRDIREKREIFGADIVLFIVGDADVEPDAGGQGPGDFFGADGGYVLVPGIYAWDVPIFSHEIQHVYGMSHEEMDNQDYSDLFNRAYLVENFIQRESNAYFWSTDFIGVTEEIEALHFLNCGSIDEQYSQWNSSDYLNAIAFYNQTDISLQVFWIDYSGQEVLVATLLPGQAHGEATASQHPWVVRSAEFPYECIGGAINRGPHYESLYFQSRF